MKDRSPITTHILDLNRGKPASAVAVTLETQTSPHHWKPLGTGHTNGDGRVEDLLPAGSPVDAGMYRLTFNTGEYFRNHGNKTFFPFVTIVFEILVTGEHYHVPLLLNANGYSTYRGS